LRDRLQKPTPPTIAQIRAITRELVIAARSASGGRADVGMRPEFAPRQSGKGQTLVADSHLHHGSTYRRRRAGPRRVQWIEKKLAPRRRDSSFAAHRRVPASPGMERFDYLLRAADAIHSSDCAASRCIGRAKRAPAARLAIVIDDLETTALRLTRCFGFRTADAVGASAFIQFSGNRRGGAPARLRGPASLADGLQRRGKDEPIELYSGMSSSAVSQTFAAMLETVPYSVGVNNHEGSRGTSDTKLMGELMPLLRERKIIFCGQPHHHGHGC